MRRENVSAEAIGAGGVADEHNRKPTYQLLLEGNLVQLHLVDRGLRRGEQRHGCRNERDLHLDFVGRSLLSEHF